MQDGKCITKQIPADIPSEIIPKMQSLSDDAKKVVLNSGDRQVHYRTQVIQITTQKGKPNVATYYVPTWEDIFADDWCLW